MLAFVCDSFLGSVGPGGSPSSLELFVAHRPGAFPFLMNPGPGTLAQLQIGVLAPLVSSAGLPSRYMVSEGRAQSGRRPATVVSGTWLGAPSGKGIGYNTCVLGVAFAKTDVAPPCYTLTCSVTSATPRFQHAGAGHRHAGGSPLFSSCSPARSCYE